MNYLIKRNEWESDFFNKEIYLLDSSKLNVNDFNENLIDAKSDLIECKVSVSECAKINFLTANGFKIIQSSIDFTKKIYNDDFCEGNIITVADLSDCDELMKIAESSITESRFGESVFGDNGDSRIYKEWVKKAVYKQYDDVCLINKVGNLISGFITCRKISNKICRIGLFVVKKEFRSKGIGRSLLIAAEKYALTEGRTTLKVATQYSNKRAIKFYSTGGFNFDIIDYWLYKV